MKSTPKSCSCSACRRGKSSKWGNVVIKTAERSFRHQSKISLQKGKEDLGSAPYSGRTD